MESDKIIFYGTEDAEVIVDPIEIGCAGLRCGNAVPFIRRVQSGQENRSKTMQALLRGE